MKSYKTIRCLMLLFPLLLCGELFSAEPDLLKSFRWEHRVILMTADEAGARAAVAELNRAAKEIDERDVYWFVLQGESIKTNFEGVIPEGFSKKITRSYFAEADGTAVRLIGKDGGVKAREDSLNLEKLFTLIDSMPMRKAEMRRE